MEWLMNNWEGITQIITGIVSLASIICAVTETNTDDDFMGKFVYPLLELLAVNVGKAKDR